MASFSIEFRDEISEALQHLIDRSEQIYLRLGEEFPRLLSEMDESVTRSRALAGQIRGTGESAGATGFDIGDTISAASGIVSEGRQRFSEMRERDDEIFSDLSRSLDSLGTLGSRIGAIKEDSIEMELISINAMTVALKAGQAGRAFSYITEELKRLSAATIEMTENIEGRGEHLQSVFAAFRQEMEEAATRQREVFGHAADRLEESFGGFREGLSEIADSLVGIADEAVAVKAPLQRIMQEVQLHDLVKQSVDHVIISLDELTRAKNAETPEEVLDELTFFESMPQLCIGILDEVSERIRSSVSLFREQSEAAERTISAVEKRCSDFVRVYVGGQANGTSSIDELYESSSGILATLLRDLRDSLRRRQRIADRSRELMKQVNNLNDDLRKFSVLVNRFRSVDIHSRIEVSKQKILQEMSGTVDEMNALTRRIEQDVNACIEDTSEFMSGSSVVLANSRTIFEEESTYVKRFSRRINDRHGELNDARSRLVSSVSNYSAFTSRFLDLFREASSQHNALEELVGIIESAKESLNEVRERAISKKSRILQESEYESWSLESDRLKKIIERFTIFTHKASAGQIGGFEVEQGQESGEVTLF